MWRPMVTIVHALLVAFLFAFLLTTISADSYAQRNPNAPTRAPTNHGPSSKLCSGERKETHFFTGVFERMIESKVKMKDIQEKYLNIFFDPKCTNNTETSRFVDGTPVLHQASKAAKNIYDTYEKFGMSHKLKFLVMLREPVSRDFSWYQHHIRQYLTGHKTGIGYVDERKGSIKEMKTFKEMWESDILKVKKGKMDREDVSTDIGGNYFLQIKEFMKYFKREQLFVMNSNLAFTHTAEAMERVRTFLGVDKWTHWETDPFPHDDHLASTQMSDDPDCVFKHVPKMDCDFRDLLAEHYADQNKALEEWLAKTRPDAPPSEPEFEKFAMSFRNVPCVEDARAELDKVIAKDTKDVC